jgi:hypothetical protein
MIKNIIDYKEQQTINQRLSANTPQLPSAIRKQMRLLARQYRIIEICSPLPDFEGYTQRKQGWVIKYQNYETGEIFEWAGID